MSSSEQSQPSSEDRFSTLNPNLKRLQKQLEQQQKMNEAIQRAMNESCTTKTLMAGAAGGLFGSFFSLFMSSMGPVSRMCCQQNPFFLFLVLHVAEQQY
jgi:hypothetical protein